jgi:hypothetical protein
MSSIRLLPVVNTRALLAIDGPAAATFNTIVEAADAYEGSAGNAITLALAAGGTWVPNVGTLTLTGNPTNEKASLDLDATLTTNCDTVIENAVAGAIGNLTTISFVADGTGAGTLDESAFPAIVFHFETGVTTVTNFETAVTAGTRLLVKTGGTGANLLLVVADDFAATALAGGTNTTVTIGSTVYSFVTTATTTAYEVEISGVNASGTIDNLIAAINLAAGSGTTYGSATAIHPTVRAFAGAGDTMVVHTKADTILTAVGTLIASTVSAASAGVTSLFPGTWAATTLADGTNGTNVAFSVAGTAVSVVFSSGYTTVSDFEAALRAHTATSALMRTKTAGTTPLYQLVVTDDDFTATNLAAGGATSSAAPTVTNGALGVALPFLCDQAVLTVRSTGGSGTMTVVGGRLWGWSPQISRWCHLGAINNGVDLAELSADYIDHTELIAGLRPFSRVYMQFSSLGGTATELEANLHCAPAAFATS